MRRSRAPLHLKTAALASAEVCPKTAPPRGGGAGRDVAPRSPSPFCGPGGPFPDAAAVSRRNIGDISRFLPAHLLIFTQPLQSNCLSLTRKTVDVAGLATSAPVAAIKPFPCFSRRLRGPVRVNNFDFTLMDAMGVEFVHTIPVRTPGCCRLLPG